MKIKNVIFERTPKWVLKLLFILTGKQGFIRILMLKNLYSNNLESMIEKVLRSGKVMVINESHNDYAALNMCYVNDMLGKALYTLSLGYVPSFKVPYYNMPGTDIWNDFFVPWGGKCYNVSAHYKSIQKNIGGPGYDIIYDKEAVTRWNIIYRMIMKFNKRTQETFDREIKRINLICKKDVFRDKKVIGVCCRGTDFTTLQPKGHPKQPNVEEIIQKAKELMEWGEWEYIYLATEEKRIVEKFVRIFGEKLLVSEREYYDKFYEDKLITHVTQVTFDREDDLYLRGMEYFTNVFVLSICDALVGGNCGATRCACIMNGGKYSYEYIFDKGCYE